MLQMTHAIASDNSTPRPGKYRYRLYLYKITTVLVSLLMGLCIVYLCLAFVSEDDIRKSVMNSSKQWDSFLSILKQEVMNLWSKYSSP